MELVEKGIPTKEIAERLNVSRTTIYNWMESGGIERPEELYRKGLSEKLQKQSAELIEEGVPVKEVAERLGVSRGTVYKWIKLRNENYNKKYNAKNR